MFCIFFAAFVVIQYIYLCLLVYLYCRKLVPYTAWFLNSSLAAVNQTQSTDPQLFGPGSLGLSTKEKKNTFTISNLGHRQKPKPSPTFILHHHWSESERERERERENIDEESIYTRIIMYVRVIRHSRQCDMNHANQGNTTIAPYMLLDGSLPWRTSPHMNRKSIQPIISTCDNEQDKLFYKHAPTALKPRISG